MTQMFMLIALLDNTWIGEFGYAHLSPALVLLGFLAAALSGVSGIMAWNSILVKRSQVLSPSWAEWLDGYSLIASSLASGIVFRLGTTGDLPGHVSLEPACQCAIAILAGCASLTRIVRASKVETSEP